MQIIRTDRAPSTKMPTWKIIEDGRANPFLGIEEIVLVCKKCGRAATVDGYGPHPEIVCAVGTGLVTEPPWAGIPDDFLPRSIQCRKCGYIYSTKGKA